MVRIEFSPEYPHKQQFSHGSVTANWGADEATPATQSATRDFLVTDILLDAQTDLTAELATQEVPVRCAIYSNTQSADLIAITMSIPSNSHIELNSPLVIPKGESYETRVQLGGATACTSDVYLVGFDRT
jgi:hypothetical protein